MLLSAAGLIAVAAFAVVGSQPPAPDESIQAKSNGRLRRSSRSETALASLYGEMPLDHRSLVETVVQLYLHSDPDAVISHSIVSELIRYCEAEARQAEPGLDRIRKAFRLALSCSVKLSHADATAFDPIYRLVRFLHAAPPAMRSDDFLGSVLPGLSELVARSHPQTLTQPRLPNGGGSPLLMLSQIAHALNSDAVRQLLAAVLARALPSVSARERFIEEQCASGKCRHFFAHHTLGLMTMGLDPDQTAALLHFVLERMAVPQSAIASQLSKCFDFFESELLLLLHPNPELRRQLLEYVTLPERLQMRWAGGVSPYASIAWRIIVILPDSVLNENLAVIQRLFELTATDSFPVPAAMIASTLQRLGSDFRTSVLPYLLRLDSGGTGVYDVLCRNLSESQIRAVRQAAAHILDPDAWVQIYRRTVIADIEAAGLEPFLQSLCGRLPDVPARRLRGALVWMLRTEGRADLYLAELASILDYEPADRRSVQPSDDCVQLVCDLADANADLDWGRRSLLLWMLQSAPSEFFRDLSRKAYADDSAKTPSPYRECCMQAMLALIESDPAKAALVFSADSADVALQCAVLNDLLALISLESGPAPGEGIPARVMAVYQKLSGCDVQTSRQQWLQLMLLQTWRFPLHSVTNAQLSEFMLKALPIEFVAEHSKDLGHSLRQLRVRTDCFRVHRLDPRGSA